MQFTGGIKPVQKEKKEVEEERTAEENKLVGDSIDGDISEARKRTTEGKNPVHETKPAREKIPTKIEKQGNGEQLLGERELSEIEKQNLVEEEEEGTVCVCVYVFFGGGS